MTTDPNTIFLITGLAFIFLGIIGGGLRIKEISIPRLNKYARITGVIVGAILIGLSRFSTMDPSSVLPPTSAITKQTPKNSSPDTAHSEEQHNSDSPINPQVIADQKFEENMSFLDDLDVNNDVLLASFQAIQSDSEFFQQLNPKQQSQVINAISTIERSMAEITAIQQRLSNNQLTVKERLNALNQFNDGKAIKRLRISALDERRIDALHIPLEKTLEGSATIASADEFKTCESVDKKMCTKESSYYQKTNPVYLWARLDAPKSARISVELINKTNKSVVEHFKADVRPSTGFRIHFSKRIGQPGEYEALLKNEDGQVIGKNQFKVI